MSLLDFAAAHPGAAVILAGLALAASALLFALPVTLATLALSWRESRGMSAEDRAALTRAAMLLRLNARQYDPDDGRRSARLARLVRLDAAEKLERMASR